MVHMDHFTHAVGIRAARLVRRLLTRICRGNITAGLYLRAAGVDVDRLAAR